MKTYLFRIAVWPDSQGFSLPEKEWAEHGITTETSGVILAPIFSEGWDEPFDMPPQYVCSEFAFAQFFCWLQTAMDLHGYSLAPERYSPAQLYEALSMSWQYAFAVEGGIPDDPIPDPDRDLEENGYGELCGQPTGHPSSEDEGAGKILESAQVRTPSTTEENIQRGREAMKRVIARHVDEPRAMYRKNVGWVSFPWGRPGTPPPIFQTDEAALTWWQSLPNKFALFSGGYGVSHILAKRDWEGKWIKELLGQNGEEIALALVTTIAKGRIEKKGASISISFNPTKMEAILRKTQGQVRGEDDESYLLTGYRVVTSKNYTFIGESAGDSGGVDDPLCRPTQNMYQDMLWGQSNMTDGRTVPTHSMLTLYPHEMGAADSVDKNILPTLPKGNPTYKGNAMNAVFERSSVADMDTIEREVRTLTTFEQIESLFQRLFGLNRVIDPDSYKNEDSDYGLKVRGKKTREKINAQCKEILARASDPADLTAEDRAVLLQYSGRGGLTENSQYEYYTPTPVAEGVWEALKANGFGNGNVLDPCCGSGVFEGTKPAGVVITGNDLDPTSSKIAALLNPEDHISTQPFERLAVTTPDNTFDSCVTNVPFGNARGASMHEDPAFRKEKQIERYFILRILDKIRPGGLACLVCPISIIGAKGKKWEEFRIAVSKKAEFLGAHKLPSKTFAAQGTETVVDVIVLRKHGSELLGRIDDIPFATLEATKVVWSPFIRGKYWEGEGKPFIMGKYVPKAAGDRWSREEVQGEIDSTTIKQKLAQKFHSRIDWETLSLAEPVTRNYSDGDKKVVNGTPYTMTAGEWVKDAGENALTTIDPQKYGVNTVEELEGILSGERGALSLSLENMFSIYKSYPNMLSALQKEAVEFAMGQPKAILREQLYRGVILGGMMARMSARSEAGEDVSAERAALQELVVADLERFGHPRNNKGLVLAGEGSRMFGLFKNAVDEEGHFSDLLAGTLDKRKEKRAYNPADPADIVIHLVVREGQEDVWLEDVQKRYQGDAPITSLGDIAEREGIAITPESLIMPMNRYCAGDIYQKMAECAEAMAKTSDERVKAKFQAQIDEMLRRRITTKSEDIVFGMRHKWFSKKYIIDFLRENGYRNIEFGSEKEVEVTRYDGTLEKEFRFVADYENPEGEYRSSVSGGFDSQFLNYLNGANITSNKAEKKQEYVEKAASLEAQFNIWMQQHPDIDELASKYNRQFNSYVPFEYEGTPLGIDDYLSGEIFPHTYQNAEVRRLSEQGSGICGFGVGLGKSFTALAMAAYNHKRGRAKRTCIVVPAAVQENWYHEARQFYAEGYMRKNVFFVGLEPKLDKNGAVQRKPLLDEQGQPRQGHDGQPLMQDVVVFTKSKEQIHDAMWKIPQSNFSLVVMTKEKFESLPLKQSTKRGYTAEMVSRSLMSEGLATQINEGKKSYKADKQISNIEARYSATGGEKAQELPFLEDMGFDSIITDESHFYKNSFEPGKRSQGIAYLPTAKAAKQAIDMAIKSHYIRSQNNGRGVYGLTATPVTNSPFEIFNMLSLVSPIEEFERFGVHTVDDFVRVFGKTETISKLTVSGEVKDVEGLVGFQNLDGLRNLFHKYVNVKTVKDVDGEIHVPTAEEQEENVEMSEEQKALYNTLRKRAKEAAQPGPKKGSDSIFSIIRDMDRLTTDIDMFHRTMTFVFQEKDREAVTRLASKLPETWLVTEKDEETREEYEHEVTVDRSLHENGSGTFSLVVPETMEDVVLMHFPELGIEEAEVAHPITPKYAQLIDNLKKHFETGGKQIVFTEEKTQHNKLRRIIVHHLPLAAGKIGIINGEVATGDKLDRISKAYNAGELKIVIANKKAEVGVNLQKGTTAIHHLTLPWTPASINQRNGRGVRQGNKADSVAVYYYCGKGTFDSYRKDLLKAKSNWINDLLMGEAKTMENGDVTGLDELLDMLADNPEEAKRMRAERLAAQNAKREEAFRINLINKMQVLASIQKNLDSIEERKATKKAALEDQRGTAQRSVSKYEAMVSNDTLSAEDRAKAGEKLASAKRRLAEAERDLSTLDEKFEKFRQKQENQKKMNVSLLRQAEREGRLPFDAALIDRPGDVVASTEGNLFAVGETLEFKQEGSIHKITAVNAQEKTVTLVPIIGGYGPGRSFRIADIPEHTKVSYSESELAVKKLLVETWVYSQIRSSGIDKDMFLSHINEIRIRWSSGAIFRANGKLDVVWDGTYSYTLPQGAVPAWPEPENESFKKAVLTRYLERVRAGKSRFSTLLEALFGPDYQSMAQEYGQRGTDAEILEQCFALWEAYKKSYRLDTAEAVEQALGTRTPGIMREVLDPIYTLYDNRNDIERVFKDYFRGLHEKAKRQAEEERREVERAANEKLKADPRYKEVPEDIAKKFSDRGIIVRINREEAYLPGFKGRAGVTHEPFSRWFFQDSAGVGGILYRMKDVLKTRYDAKFTKDWREHGGAWWHVNATIDIQELYELLS